MLSLVLKIPVVVCGLAAVLRLFDFDVGPVLAGLLIGGLAFALAAQDTLKNFFRSFMLIDDTRARPDPGPGAGPGAREEEAH